MNFILPLLISLTGTILFTPFLINYLLKYNFVDEPGERKVHDQSIPRIGGIIIYAAIILNIFLFIKDLSSMRMILLGSFIIIMCGIMDDILDLSWKIKIALQSAAAICILSYFSLTIHNIYLFGIDIPFPLSYVFLFVFAVGCINSINFIDGLDGLASGYSLVFFFTMLILGIVSHNIILLIISTIFIGSLIGFLKYNAFPAKIFLGDTGSLLLGYFIVFSAFTLVTKIEGVFDLTIPIILLSISLVDALKIIVVRLYKKRNPFLADKNHLHHLLLGVNIRHKLVVFFVIGMSVGFSALAIYYIYFSKFIGLLIFIFANAILLFGQYYIKTSSLEDSKNFMQGLIIVPKIVKRNFTKVFIPLSVLIVFVYIMLCMPFNSGLDKKVIVTLLVSELSLLAAATLNKKKTGIINDLYIFVNFIIFFTFSHFSSTFSTIIKKALIIDLFTNYSLISILLLIVFFVMARHKILLEKISFLSGLDLIFSIVVCTSFIMNVLLQNVIINTLSLILISAFIIYLWYKLVSIFNDRYIKLIYYTSFALPTISLLIILLL
ncbi:MAG TPA: MraY family glycosyltransferase [Ignavibacteriaceae bacterium]|nr:MraY family glycosyltransferase [Ignavibacteriaceae bacterium]